jgi:ligand-binding sensor domain-containing protein
MPTESKFVSVRARELVLYVLFAIFGLGIGVAAPLRLGQLDHLGWTSKDGAPVGISSIAEAHDGTLWLGSDSGLYNFDGTRFVAFQPKEGEPQLPFTDVSTLCVSQDDTTWVGFWLGTVAAIHNGAVRIYGEHEGLPFGSVRQILQAPDGTMWVLAHNRLFHLQASRWIAEPQTTSFLSEDVTSFFFDKNGTEWVTAGTSVYARPKGAMAFMRRGAASPALNYFVEAPDSSLWLLEEEPGMTPNVLRQISGLVASRRQIVIPDGNDSLFDRQGSLWLTSVSFGVVRVRPEHLEAKRSSLTKPGDANGFESYGRVDGLTSNSSNVIFEDRTGNIWVGTNRGLDRFKEPALIRYVDYALGPDPSVAACPNGTIWIASTASPLLSYWNGKTEIHGEMREIHNLFCDQTNVVWFNQGDGLWRYDGGRFQHIPSPAIFSPYSVRQVVGKSEASLYVSVKQDGLWHYSNSVWTKVYVPGFSNDVPISIIHQDRDGRLWVGFLNGSIALLEAKFGRTNRVIENADIGGVEALQEGRRGLFVGGANGLALIRGGNSQMLRFEDALAGRGISGLFEAANGDLWLNSLNGVIRVPSEEIDAAIKSSDHRMRSEVILLDGGPTAPAPQQLPFPTTVTDGNGHVWFATGSQILSVDTTAVPAAGHLHGVNITSVVADGIAKEDQANLVLKRVQTLRIGYSAVDLSSPEQVRYRYMLDGEDKNWQEAGDRTEATYTALRPGRHIFHVAASDNGRDWREAPIPLEFMVLPPFYETVWFRVLCLLLAVALFWSIFSLRVHFISVRIRERAEERVRVARELHDTLLQGIQGLMLRLHYVAKRVPPGSEEREFFDVALDSASKVFREARDQVQELRTSATDETALEDSLAAVGRELKWNDDVQFSIQVEGLKRQLRPSISGDLFGIGRESLTNAFRHSGASRITLTIVYGRTEFGFSCRDNGCGIESTILQQGLSGHWGLLGMRERAGKIGADLNYLSTVGTGMEIFLKIPARRAYEPGRGNWLKRISGSMNLGSSRHVAKPTDESETRNS